MAIVMTQTPITYEKGPEVLTFTDRVLAKTLLLLFPRKVTPNQITTFRFVTVPFVFYLLIYGEYGWGGLLFAFSALSDALDGALARTTDRITDWGKIYDPLADKLLVGAATSILVVRFVNLYLALAMIIIELVVITAAYYKRFHQNKEIQANTVAKTKMALQSIGIIVLFIHAVSPSDFLLAWAGAILAVGVLFAALTLFVYRSI